VKGNKTLDSERVRYRGVFWFWPQDLISRQKDANILCRWIMSSPWTFSYVNPFICK